MYLECSRDLSREKKCIKKKKLKKKKKRKETEILLLAHLQICKGQ